MEPLRSALMEGCCPARVVLRRRKRACQNLRARAQRLRHAAIACGCSLTHLQHWLDERDLEVSEFAREPQLARKRRVRKDVVGELKHLALLQEGAAQRGRGRGGTRQWRGMGEMGDGRCQLFRLSQREGAHSRKESRARGSGVKRARERWGGWRNGTPPLECARVRNRMGGGTALPNGGACTLRATLGRALGLGTPNRPIAQLPNRACVRMRALRAQRGHVRARGPSPAPCPGTPWRPLRPRRTPARP